MSIRHPKNHYKYCPRCSVAGTFTEKTFSFKCDSCGFHFFLNSATAVTALIFNDNQELLLTRRAIDPERGKIDLPGGFVDPGENAEHAIFRELKEELDVVPAKIEFFGSFANDYHFSGTTVYTVDIVFVCTITDFSTLTFRDDIEGIEFVNPELVDLNDVPFKSVKQIIKKVVASKMHIKK